MEWRKASFCGADSDFCVEVAPGMNGEMVWIKDREGSLTSFSREEFGTFIQGVKAGEFDDLT